ncbi:MAG: cryptochrome/photolyase family protein, partial [Bacteroidota bacterium]|nr:cryptochrome/photolyase family protein [Bacteroidota bacterium]
MFQNHPALQKDRTVYLLEENLFFRQYPFHQQKLVLHRASMKFYEEWLQKNNYPVRYIETTAVENDCRRLVQQLAEQNTKEIHIAEVADNWLQKRMEQACSQNHIRLFQYDSPNFLHTPQSLREYFDKKKTYFQTDFYT